MAFSEFSEATVKEAWKRASGGYYPPSPAYCECQRVTHDHDRVRCRKRLTWANRGREEMGAWEAHSISGRHLDTPSDCEILCWRPCHKGTL